MASARYRPRPARRPGCIARERGARPAQARRGAPRCPRGRTRRRPGRARLRAAAWRGGSRADAHASPGTRRPRASPDPSYREIREIRARAQVGKDTIRETEERAITRVRVPHRERPAYGAIEPSLPGYAFEDHGRDRDAPPALRRDDEECCR